MLIQATATLSFGAQMSKWKGWIDGTRKKPDWGVFNRTYEYRLSTEREGL
ncbi:hypothetical protein wcw_0029 [Waddlia chondrophila WSU 86-1044]|uniref:Uncharacterized protein n=1 Tax=Waddlia chondrophila (strain ATCC VR-1470 / WSU 86-1044) TaxID=716544 RepID=D6YTE5_WADCW|nr:hypothetical protein wcw_0029 [Waddlia chondrophila WSU 86-1044]